MPPEPSAVTVRPRAKRDLRAIAPVERKRIIDALRQLTEQHGNLDVKPLRGAPGRLRLRVGDYRVLYLVTDEAYVVERVVHRSELERAVRTLGG